MEDKKKVIYLIIIIFLIQIFSVVLELIEIRNTYDLKGTHLFNVINSIFLNVIFPVIFSSIMIGHVFYLLVKERQDIENLKINYLLYDFSWKKNVNSIIRRTISIIDILILLVFVFEVCDIVSEYPIHLINDNSGHLVSYNIGFLKYIYLTHLGFNLLIQSIYWIVEVIRKKMNKI